MTDITALERRIAAALDRIGSGVAALGTVAPVAGGGRAAGRVAREAAGADAERLREQLDAERTANAQLTERVRAIKERQENMVSQLERKVARLTQQLDAQGLEVQRQKRANSGLVDANKALNAAAQAGVSDAHLVNKAMLVELEALRAARASDIAEMDEILQELKPYIGEATNA